MSTIWNVSRANNVITGKSSKDFSETLIDTQRKAVRPIFIFSFPIADFVSVIVFSFVTTKFFVNMTMKSAWFLLIWPTIHPIWRR